MIYKTLAVFALYKKKNRANERKTFKMVMYISHHYDRGNGLMHCAIPNGNVFERARAISFLCVLAGRGQALTTRSPCPSGSPKCYLPPLSHTHTNTWAIGHTREKVHNISPIIFSAGVTLFSFFAQFCGIKKSI